jgi:hypothetical protein
MRALLLALVAGISCGHLIDPPLPEDALVFHPPAVYAKWWAMVESCSALSGSLEDVNWYSTKSQIPDPNDNDATVVGYWSLAGNRIVLSASDTIAGDVVRHEMLHALLRVAGHPRAAFLQACGGVVSCSQECVRDAGLPGLPGPGTTTVTPAELEVTSAVSSATPSTTVDGGLATFTISVHNPFTHPVIVTLPTGAWAAPVSFTFAMVPSAGVGRSSTDLAFDVGVTYFAAGETKRDVIDFFVINPDFPSYLGFPGLGTRGIDLPVGTYSFRGSYGGKAATDLAVVLSQ